jgi:molybdate transport system substrate-binding protein
MMSIHVVRSIVIAILGFPILWLPSLSFADQKITVYAAASLTNAIGEISSEYEKVKLVKIQSSFAASSALAKQIENGAPVDIFISADTKWMNYLQDKKRINAESRINLLSNRLVLVAPKGYTFKLQMDQSSNLAGAFNGKLCTGETESVPVGIYAKQSLIALGWWDEIKPRLVGAQDVRAALNFVERGECGAGIVYETDAKVSDKVEIVAAFPDDSHDPIIYPLAMVDGAQPDAKAFVDYLGSAKAKSIFIKFGFTPIGK